MGPRNPCPSRQPCQVRWKTQHHLFLFSSLSSVFPQTHKVDASAGFFLQLRSLRLGEAGQLAQGHAVN